LADPCSRAGDRSGDCGARDRRHRSFADETTEDRVRATVERFVAARDDGDFAEVCGMLTPVLQREIEATS
jgi:hypothetical protein